MTEAEWMAATDPFQMLDMLDSLPESASERKLRLHACLCCRRIWHVIPAELTRRCVEVAELYADGQATREELQAAIAASMEACNRLPRPLAEPAATAINAVSRVHRSAAGGRHAAVGLAAAAWAGAEAVQRWVAGDTTEILAERRRVLSDQERARQCDYLRELFGNPFQPVAADPQWLTSTVVALAEGVYQDRAWDRLPILADALMDAGCDCEELLGHFRNGGPHCRGCWVVDLLTGRK